MLNEPYKKIEFSKNLEADELTNDIENYPHVFVLACLMDRQMKAEKAWLIPYEVSREINGFEFSKLHKLKLIDVQNIFKRKNLHRFNDLISKYFYSAIQKIHNYYNDDASNI